MSTRGCLAVALVGLASVAAAQDRRLEISGSVGYTLADGVSGEPMLAGDGNVYDRVDPQDAASFNLSVAYFFTPNWQAEVVWDRQPTHLEVGGTRSVEVGELHLDNFHGVASYRFREVDSIVRPYLSLGAGVTRAGELRFTGPGGQPRTIDGSTRFSPMLGAGLKVYPGAHAGLRVGVRWTPTYIKSGPNGWWCDPYWGCYVVEDAQYSNQIELAAGLTLRF